MGMVVSRGYFCRTRTPDGEAPIGDVLNTARHEALCRCSMSQRWFANVSRLRRATDPQRPCRAGRGYRRRPSRGRTHKSLMPGPISHDSGSGAQRSFRFRHTAAIATGLGRTHLCRVSAKRERDRLGATREMGTAAGIRESFGPLRGARTRQRQECQRRSPPLQQSRPSQCRPGAELPGGRR